MTQAIAGYHPNHPQPCYECKKRDERLRGFEAGIAELIAELQDWWELSSTAEKTLVAERKLARERED